MFLKLTTTWMFKKQNAMTSEGKAERKDKTIIEALKGLCWKFYIIIVTYVMAV